MAEAQHAAPGERARRDAESTAHVGRAQDVTPPPGVLGVPPAGRTLVMGVINVTPDSFSDGGVYADPGEASGAGSRCSRRAPTSSTSAANRPGPGRLG